MKIVLIIEDDYSFAIEIEMMLKEIGGYLPKVVSTYREAKTILNSLKPDFILSDVYLDDQKTVFDIIKPRHLDIPLVLFSSVDDEELYNKAKTLQSYIFLVKPFNVKSLRSVIHNLEKPSNPTVQTLKVRSNGRQEIIEIKDIFYFESKGNYCIIHTVNRTLIVRSTFDKLIAKTNSPLLQRIHRGFMVNLNKIQTFDIRNSEVILSEGLSIPVARKYKAELKQNLM